MAGTLGWIALLGAVLGLEVSARRGARWPTLGRLAERVGARWPGRVALVAAWLFVGLHLFARYTVPR